MDGLLLRDVVKAIVDCPHSTPKWESSGVYAIRNYNLVNGKVDLSNPSYVSEDEYKERVRRAIPEPGDIIISREAPIGNVGVIPKGCRCCLGQRVVLIKVDKTKYDPYYLSLVLQSPDLQHQMASSSGMGTTVCNLRIPCIEQLVVPSTVRQLQDKIVKIIGCLDSLITINQLINDNLGGVSFAS